jgi:hypothetical protein
MEKPNLKNGMAEISYVETERGGYTAIGKYFLSRDGELKPESEYSEENEM